MPIDPQAFPAYRPETTLLDLGDAFFDPVAAAEVAVRPEGVEPAVHALGGVVLLQRRVQDAAGAAGPEEGRDLGLGLGPFLGGEQRCAPGEEPLAARFERGQRHAWQAGLPGEGGADRCFLADVQFGSAFGCWVRAG